MDKLNEIEQYFSIKLPEKYKNFLLNIYHFAFENNVFDIILQDGCKKKSSVYKFYTLDNFIAEQQYRDYLMEFQIHFEIPNDYVESKYLYHIAEALSGSICIAIGGQHNGKIYSVDNGDFGIIYQADNIDDFIKSLYHFEP